MGGVRVRAAALAGAWLVLAAGAGMHYAEDRAGRAAVLRFAHEWGFDVRRPAQVAQVALEPSVDVAAGFLADAAVADEIFPVKWKELGIEEREAWLDAVGRRGEMLEAAHRLALSALAANPGLAFHYWRTGQLGYLVARRGGAEALKSGIGRWHAPLRIATRLAPGLELGWGFLSAALLETWPLLPEETKRDGREVLARAFLDPEFARRAFLPVSVELGREAAMSLVPDVPGPLAAAQRAVTAAGDVAAAAALQERWEKAESELRRADLAHLERRARMGDEDGLRAGCRAFVAKHPLRKLNGGERETIAARMLALWPHDRAGRWRGDGRAELLRLLLDARHEGVEAEAVSRAASALLEVPEPERARLALLAGNRYGWESIVRESKTVGSLEWTTFFAELARAELRGGRAEAAKEALGRIAPRARGECAVLLARREEARASGDAGALAEVEAELAQARAASTGPEAWSSAWSLPLCVDPEVDAEATLSVGIISAAPALLALEVNGGRRETFVVEPGEATLSVPLEGLQGVAVVSIPLLAGPRPALVSASRQAAAAAPETSASVAAVAGSERLKSTSP